MLNTVPKEAPTRYYHNREGMSLWGALIICIGIIIVGASIAAHSWLLTSGFVLGIAAIWYLGYWALSKSCYFISATSVGFKDAFRVREVQFAEIRSATKDTGRQSITLVFVCQTRTVCMPVDPCDEAWFSAVKTELLQRGIPISSRACGFKLKEG